MSDFRILGVDPGASGALGFYDPEFPNVCSAADFPLADGLIAPAQLARDLEIMRPTVCVFEVVGAMPKQGVSSTFSFGKNVGLALGVIGALRIPVHFVTPGKWKKHFRLAADKEEARARAIELFPSSDYFKRKKDHGRAEAVLIARYGHEALGLGRGRA